MATDAIKLIKDDHKAIKKLFRQFEKAKSDDEKMAAATQALEELQAHAKIEEEIFYPAVRAKAEEEGDDEAKDLLNEANEEHHVAEVLMGELKQIGKVDETFEAKFKVLIESVEHHIEEEEGEMLPDAKEKLGKDTKALGEKMGRRKQELLGAAAR
jgi:hemerythrin superfamily protein